MSTSEDGGAKSDSGGMGITDSATPGPCQAYADKAFGCCSGEANCAGSTHNTFIAYCTEFYTGCTKYYDCYLGASTCTAAEACPTLGNGGCS